MGKRLLPHSETLHNSSQSLIFLIIILNCRPNYSNLNTMFADVMFQIDLPTSSADRREFLSAICRMPVTI